MVSPGDKKGLINKTVLAVQIVKFRKLEATKIKRTKFYIEGNKINLSISFFLTLADSICPETITRNTEL